MNIQWKFKWAQEKLFPSDYFVEEREKKLFVWCWFESAIRAGLWAVISLNFFTLIISPEQCREYVVCYVWLRLRRKRHTNSNFIYIHIWKVSKRHYTEFSKCNMLFSITFSSYIKFHHKFSFSLLIWDLGEIHSNSKQGKTFV